MKLKRIMAVLIAVLMVLTVIPAAAFAVTDPAPGDTEEEAGKAEAAPKAEKVDPALKSLADHLFTPGTELDLTNYIPGFSEQEATTDGTTYYWIESNNYGQASTEATISIDSFYMNSGETITFEYWYETEENYDKFIFRDNGTQVFAYSGSSNGWITYTYTCTSSGQHEFEFIYHKDPSGNTGADCVRIGYLTYSRQKDFYLTRAALNKGMSGNIINVATTGTYPFYVKETEDTGHELYLYSGNKGVGNSTSTLTVKAWVEQAPVDFTFSYAISCEATYDYFKFSVNGTEAYRTSGHNDYSWTSYTYTCAAQGLYTFTFEFIKDGNINQGEDVVCIDNLRFAQQDAYGRAADYNYVWSDEANLNATNSDAFLTFNSPKGTSSFVGTNNAGGNDYRAINNNRYLEGSASSSYIETIVNMAAGETLSFQYQVSSEEDYDGLRFSVNGDTELFASGWEQSNWRSFTYTAPSTGSYVMRWEYTKDSSVSKGFDYAMIDTVRYVGSHSYGNALNGWGYHNTFTVQDAFVDANNNAGNCRVYSDIIDGNEYFLPYKDGSNNCLISRNKYYESTTAFADVYCDGMHPGDQIRFEYTVRSESTDKLHINIDVEGTSNDVNQFINGNASDSWHTFTWTCAYAEDVVIHFEFVKNSSVNTEPDCCMLRNLAITAAPDPGLDNAMNAPGSELHFNSSGAYKWESAYLGSDLCAMPTNRGNLTGGDTCTATVSATVYMDYGSLFSFQYKADLNNISYSDWTPRFTCTVTTTEGETILDLNQSANVSSWTTKYYEAFTSGLYTFTWTYSRPERGWEFEPFDVIAVRNCGVSPDAGIEWHSIDEALNAEGGTLHFETDSVWSDFWRDDDIATSATWAEPNTNATLTTSVQMAAGDKLRFQYFVSSEQDYDYLVFRVNGSEVFTASGLVEWEWYEWTAPSAGNYQFEWTYHKDGSVNRGMDCFKLDYVEHIAGTPGGLLGDVNGDGTVAIDDALLAMRHAMGLLSLSAEQLARANVNGDSVVDISDALLIMRYAMGLITHF